MSGVATAAYSRPSRTRRFARWLASDLRAAASLFYLTAMMLVAVLAPFVAPYSPLVQDVSSTLLPPGGSHLLGTDDLGRDVWSRLIWGAPESLYGSVFAVCVALLIGLPIGLCAGLAGGWVDEVIGRAIDTLLSFPAIVLAIGVTGALGAGLTNGMLSVGIVFSPALARLIRAQVLVARRELYVEASRCFGARLSRVVLRHILPNTIQPIIVQTTLLLAVALLAEASLSFLGLGVQPPQPSWGSMLARAATYMEVAPEQMYAPGLAILFTALAFNALGESLRVALDPTEQRR